MAVNRRQFLKISGYAAPTLALLASGCKPTEPPSQVNCKPDICEPYTVGEQDRCQPLLCQPWSCGPVADCAPFSRHRGGKKG